jgi:alpha-N-arabinofuranosidase
VAKIIISANKSGPQISRHIYGHFAEHLGRCIYEGIWVGPDSKIPNTRGIRNDVVQALKKIKIPVLRWPGGCFADEYHWRDGIGPQKDRPSIVNTHWGGTTEDNQFGTHEFLDLCEQLGTEPYICGNVGSGTVREMSEWVEYVNFGGKSPMSDLRQANGRAKPWNVKFWGVGNENWGCGGNMRPEYYADLYWQFQTYCRNYPDRKLAKIAGGANNEDYAWTEALMKSHAIRKGNDGMHGLSLHRYITSWGGDIKRGRATEFAENGWAWVMEQSFGYDAMLKKHSAIMDKHDKEKKVGIVFDEWGTWFDVEEGTNPGFLYQQNTLRDAVSAAIVMNIFNQHADRVRMANIAQTINVLQAMILTDKEKMLLTPTYHVFDMYAAHQDATLLPLKVESPLYGKGKQAMPMISASASRRDQGDQRPVHLTLANAHPTKALKLELALAGLKVESVTGRILSAKAINAHNTFENPRALEPSQLEGLKISSKGASFEMPARSVIALDFKVK